MAGFSPWIESLIQDVRYGVRLALRSRTFAAGVVFSLAIGIGGSSAIFTAMDAMLLRTLPVPSPDRLVTSDATLSTAFVKTLPEAAGDAFSSVAGIAVLDRYDVSTAPDAAASGQSMRVALVTGSYFPTLGIGASAGRPLAIDDDRVPDAHPVAMISAVRAARDFGGAAAVGRTIRINDTRFTIVGVAPAGFAGDWIGRPIDVWVPAAMESEVMKELPRLATRGNGWLRLVARMRDGVAIERAQAAATLALRRFERAEAGPSASAERLRLLAQEPFDLMPLTSGYLADRVVVRRALDVLLAMAAIILLATIANVASLLLVRGSARSREMVLRAALGAGRGRLVRQLLAESLLLAAAGGTLGILLSTWIAAAFSSRPFGPVQMDSRAPSSWVSFDVAPNARGLAFAVAVTVATGVLFGLLPALRGSRVSLAPSLSVRNATGARRTALRIIVAAQLAMSLVLIAGAGFFTRSLAALSSQTLGIDREHVLLVWTAPGQTGREGAALEVFARQAVDRLKTLPGARAVGASNHGPLEGGADAGGASELLRVEGRPPKAGMQIMRTAVTPGFFAAVGAPLVAGRDFTDRDTERAPQVAVVGDNLARFLFGSESAIGRRFTMGDGGPAIEIVGVAPAIRHGSPRDLRGNVYVPARQQPGLLRTMCLEILTTGEPSALAPAVRAELGRLDPHLPVLHIDTVEQQLGDVLVRERVIALLASTFAVVAMLLAGAGLYALTAYHVAQRTAEIGIRVALGASPHRILWLTARENLAMLAAGTAAGVALAFAAGRFVSSLLFGAGSFDAPTIAAAALILAGVATVAASLPARRAARLDPIAALRCD